VLEAIAAEIDGVEGDPTKAPLYLLNELRREGWDAEDVCSQICSP